MSLLGRRQGAKPTGGCPGVSQAASLDVRSRAGPAAAVLVPQAGHRCWTVPGARTLCQTCFQEQSKGRPACGGAGGTRFSDACQESLLRFAIGRAVLIREMGK